MENFHRNFDHEHGRRGRPGRVGRQGRRGGFGPDFGPHDHAHHRHGGFGPGDGFGGHRGHRGMPGERLGRGRGRGGRGRRGDVRTAILLLLAEEPQHGYELIQRIAERSNGVWRPSPGSIYPALAQLEDEGLVLIEKVAGRKTARLTESGTAYVAEHKDELGNPWDEIRASVGVPAQELRELVQQLAGAARQVASVGTADQAKAAADVLTEARRALYRILADEPGQTEGVGQSEDVSGVSDAEQ